MSYESPIGVYPTKVLHEIEGEILRVIQNLEVVVDKEELIRALQYDREQYDRGYADGYMDAKRELIHCAECEHYCPDTLSCRMASNYDGNWYPEDFCSYGKRREE